ncbi:MAG: PRC-barrel domain containing protein [Actinobacteria bacterium]|nr:MAG: PRC-barrel domain containing protein [Actinomycetota bacterium]
MPDPVAWTVVERGWQVIGAAGEKLGYVDDVLGDPDADIFDGLSVSGGLFKERRYVPAEQVGSIYAGEIHLLIDKNEFERLPPAQ